MAHNHNHTTENIGLAFWLNLGFTLLEIVGGVWTNSTAILSDAVHDLGDSFSLGMAWLLERRAQKGSSATFSYGYGRLSLLSALLNTIVLITGSLLVLARAVPRLLNPEPTNAQGMFWFAIVGILVNGLAAWRLRGETGLNARVVSWHMIEDVLGWVAVLVVSIVLFFTQAYILDPLLSIIITLYVLFNVAKNLRKTAVLFLQGTPDDIDVAELERQIAALPQVQAVHHIHTWSLDGEHHVFSAHLVVDETVTCAEATALKKQVRALLNGHEFTHTAIEIEFANEACQLEEEAVC
ncbi:MAG: cation transporter [Anaerolineae bacterium]|nr:cation transporter [Anaerolineae bacterium]